jgi:hypothetical protein
MLIRLLSVLSLGSVAASVAATSVPATTAADRASLSMTIYQQGFALVRDERTVMDLGLGRRRLTVVDISDQILPASVLVTGQGLTLHAVDYTGVSLTPDRLLERHVGKTVRLIRRDAQTGALVAEKAALLSAAGGVPIVKIGDRIEIGGTDAPWRLAFDSVPDGLQGRPSLALDLENSTRGPQSLVLTYLSWGLSWRADYVGILRDGMLMFSGWISLENVTGNAYPSARVQLLAGDVNRPGQVRPMQAMARAAEAEQADLASAPVSGHHLYDLAEPVALPPARRQRVRLLAPRGVPFEREYRVSSEGLRQAPEEEAVPVAVRLHLVNSAPALGKPLPAGWAGIYTEGPQGMMQYLGGAPVGHTPTGEKLVLEIGAAFDVTARQKTASFRRIDARTAELEQRIRLANQQDRPVTVVVAKRLPGDWELQSSSHPHQRVSAQLAEWRVEVPAAGEALLTYRARVRY